MLGTLAKYILPHDPFVLPTLMITCYIGPANSLEDAREMVCNTKQLMVHMEVIHKFVAELTCRNPTRISHNATNFSNHIFDIVPGIIMDSINFEAMLHKADLGDPRFLEIDEAMHDDYARHNALRPDEDADPDGDVVQRSVVVLPHILSNGMHELKDVALRQLNNNLLAIPTSRKPAPDYDRRYFLKNYPNIFFYDQGERPCNMARPTYIKTLMNRSGTGTVTDFSFPFEAWNVMI